MLPVKIIINGFVFASASRHVVCVQIIFIGIMEIHELMSDEEYKDIFGTSRDNVAEYDIVPVYHSSSFQGNEYNNPVSFEAFGETIKLNFHPVAHTAVPVWWAYGVDNKSYRVLYSRVDSLIMYDAFKFYEDPENMAGVAIEVDNGNIRFTGALRDRLTIKPVPRIVLEEWSRLFHRKIKPRSIENPQLPLVSDYHIIIRNNKDHAESSNFHQHSTNTVKRSIPNDKATKIFPRILIITNYETQYETDRDLKFYRSLIYQIAFWNSVNLRYKQFSNPIIQFQIAGIVVGKNRFAAPYLDRYTVSEGVGYPESLDEFGLWANQSLPIDRDSWDIAVTMTDRKLCDTENYLKCNVQGGAFIRAACLEEGPPTVMTALIVDDENFLGISSAIHELGHLLGADHDGEKAGSACSNGNIMAPNLMHNGHGWSFSGCSIASISRHIKENYPDCWDKSVKQDLSHLIGREIPEILPGDLHSLDQQCRSWNYGGACEPNEDTCRNLRCYDAGQSERSRCYETNFVPLDGAPCGRGRKCRLGKCEF